jgi:glycine betaine/proline transport system substrate-binding protein
MRDRVQTRSIGLAFLATLVAIAALPARAQDRTVRLGQVNLSFYAVVGAVVQELLEKDGYPVSVTSGSHGEIFPKLGAGEVDLLAAAWLPDAHAPLYAKVKDVTFVVGELYDQARLFWAVPDYVPADLVRSIEDLKKPEVMARIDKNIHGIGASSGLMVGAEENRRAYGLDTFGYQVIPGETKDWIGNFRQAVAEQRWMVMPLWQPQWLNSAYKVRALADPKGIYGQGDTAVLLGHQSLKRKLADKTLRRLAVIKLSVDQVTEMDRLVNVDGLTPRDAARRWLASNLMPEAR